MREDLRFTWTVVANGQSEASGLSWSNDKLSRIVASPVHDIWVRLQQARLDELCQVGTGIDAPLGMAKFGSKKQRGFVPYLHTQTRLKPYFLLEQDWQGDPDSSHDYVNPATARWPKEALWPLFEAPKIIIRCDTNRNTRRQIAAAYDEAGVYPEHHFRCLGLREVPESDRAKVLTANHSQRQILLWLTAIINSPVGHAWVATWSPPRGLLGEVVESLPLPAHFDPAIPDLVQQSRKCSRQTDDAWVIWEATEGEETGQRRSTFQSLVQRINDLVLQSFGLDQLDAERLRSCLRGMTNPWIEAPRDAHLPLPKEYRRISGTVVEIDVKNQRVTLELPRYARTTRGLLTIPTPMAIPGWALTPGAQFTCMAPATSRNADDLMNPWLLRDFMPLPYSYLDVTVLEKLVGVERQNASVD